MLQAAPGVAREGARNVVQLQSANFVALGFRGSSACQTARIPYVYTAKLDVVRLPKLRSWPES
jgi:hypothetical protein